MAVRNISVTDTLETFRTEFNDLAALDFGDIANLNASLSSTNLVAAMNETLNVATNTAGFTIRDSSSTGQIVGGGDTLTVLGTANEIEAVVSTTDTLTIGLPNNVTISNNLTASGSTHTLGTIEISGNTIRSTDSTRININDVFRANSFETTTALLQIDEAGGYPRIQSTRGDKFLIFGAIPTFEGNVIFEGSGVNDFETTLTVVDPTADRTITIPDETGTLITTGSTDNVSESMMADDAVGQDQLKTVVTLQILNSSGTVLKTIYGAGA